MASRPPSRSRRPSYDGQPSYTNTNTTSNQDPFATPQESPYPPTWPTVASPVSTPTGVPNVQTQAWAQAHSARPPNTSRRSGSRSRDGHAQVYGQGQSSSSIDASSRPSLQGPSRSQRAMRRGSQTQVAIPAPAPGPAPYPNTGYIPGPQDGFTPHVNMHDEHDNPYPPSWPVPVPIAQRSPLLEHNYSNYTSNTVTNDPGTPYRDADNYNNYELKDPPTPGGGAYTYTVPSVRNEKRLPRSARGSAFNFRSRRTIWIIVGVVALVIVAVSIPVALSRKSQTNNASNSKSTPKGSVTGGFGSTITASDGSTFIYNNTFGGFWVDDPSNPSNASARPNSWTPPLSQKWDFSSDAYRIHGVNLGGLFVLEPFITPHFFQKKEYYGAVDEYTLSKLMRSTGNGSMAELEHHYDTFITERDIAQIATAGLNWIRLPIPFWALDSGTDAINWPGSSEPYLPAKAWPYIVRVLKWCRKYGLRVNLDMHALPGSQNGYNHSGRIGPVNAANPARLGNGVNWMFGPMGYANAQRSLDYIRTVVEAVSKAPEEGGWRDVVGMFSPVNEPLLGAIGVESLTRFYFETHNMVRSITGVGTGPYIAIHEGFTPDGLPTPWLDFLPGADRMVMDQHPYLAFSGTDAMRDPFSSNVYPLRACTAWRNATVNRQRTFGVTIAGEFSNGWNDCALFLIGVPPPGGEPYPQSYPGDCATWTAYEHWGQETRDGLKDYALASMNALENWFFWTWKIGPALNGTIMAPLWSYQLGLEQGWMPQDPRASEGMCDRAGAGSSKKVVFDAFDGKYKPSQTGEGDGKVAETARAAFGQWPPISLKGQPTAGVRTEDPGAPWRAMPTYTQTGTMSTLGVTYPPTSSTSSPKATSSGTKTGTGEVRPRFTPVKDCVYPDPYMVTDAGAPTTVVCSGGAQATMGDASGSVQPLVRPTGA